MWGQGVSEGGVPPQKRRKIVIFKVNSHWFGAFFLPGAPTQNQASYLCKKNRGGARPLCPPPSKSAPDCGNISVIFNIVWEQKYSLYCWQVWLLPGSVSHGLWCISELGELTSEVLLDLEDDHSLTVFALFFEKMCKVLKNKAQGCCTPVKKHWWSYS